MTLRVATVGAGYFGQFHYDAWRRMDGANVTALAAATPAEAEAASATYGVDAHFTDVAQMLEAVKPDLLDIISPPPTHRPFIELALARGIPVICQKPFCGGYADAQAVAARSRETGVPVIVHENFRFQPWHRHLKQLIDDDLLGDLHMAAFRLRPGDGQGPEAYLDRQPYFQEMERFLVHETAIHLIDVFRYLFGEVKSVYADLRRLNPVIAGEDAGLIVFHFESGLRGLFDGNRLNDHVAENRRLTIGEMTIEGAKGILTLFGSGDIHFRAHGANTSVAMSYDWIDQGFAGDSVFATQKAAVDFLRGEAPGVNTAEDYLVNQLIEEAVYYSDKTREAVDMAGFDALA